MSFLRRHIFPLFGAAMTLAVGIALGAGPFQDDTSVDESDDLASANSALSDQVQNLESRQAFDAAVAGGVASDLLVDRLEGRTVTLVVFPGVAEERADAARAAIKAAGGETAISLTLSDDLLDPAKKTYVSSVAASSLDGAKDVAKTVDEDPYAQLGALLARAYIGAGDDIAIDDEATVIDSEIQGAGLVAVSGEPHQRGSALVVLADGDHGDDVSIEASGLISTSLIEPMASAAAGTVVATPSTGRAAGGLLDVIESDDSFAKSGVSTLNVSDGPAASAAGVLALAASLADKAGAYGIDGATVDLPPGMPETDAE